MLPHLVFPQPSRYTCTREPALVLVRKAPFYYDLAHCKGFIKLHSRAFAFPGFCARNDRHPAPALPFATTTTSGNSKPQLESRLYKARHLAPSTSRKSALESEAPAKITKIHVQSLELLEKSMILDCSLFCLPQHIFRASLVVCTALFPFMTFLLYTTPVITPAELFVLHTKHSNESFLVNSSCASLRSPFRRGKGVSWAGVKKVQHCWYMCKCF